jgi:hypothetical protein
MRTRELWATISTGGIQFDIMNPDINSLVLFQPKGLISPDKDPPM